MWLKKGDHTVLVSSQGGSVLQWQYREHVILGPARVVLADDGTLKTRGETHWCFPNFGSIRPGGPKHGYIRDTVMEGEKVGDASVGFFTLKTHTSVAVSLFEEALSFGLSHKADGLMPILPALHPYFAVPPAGLLVSMDGKPLAFAKGGHSEEISSKSLALKRTGTVMVELCGIGKVSFDLLDDCSHIVLWTDKVSEYVCVEPVFGAPGSYGKEDGRWLKPGQLSLSVVKMGFKPS